MARLRVGRWNDSCTMVTCLDETSSRKKPCNGVGFRSSDLVVGTIENEGKTDEEASCQSPGRLKPNITIDEGGGQSSLCRHVSRLTLSKNRCGSRVRERVLSPYECNYVARHE